MMKRKLVAYVLVVLMSFAFSISAFADSASVAGETEFDLTNHETQVQEVALPNGELATIVLEYVNPPQTRATYPLTDGDWKIYWYQATLNTDYHITISNGKITNAYDLWYLGVGWTVTSANLSFTSTKSTATLDVQTSIYDVITTRFNLTATISGNNLITKWE